MCIIIYRTRIVIRRWFLNDIWGCNMTCENHWSAFTEELHMQCYQNTKTLTNHVLIPSCTLAISFLVKSFENTNRDATKAICSDTYKTTLATDFMVHVTVQITVIEFFQLACNMSRPQSRISSEIANQAKCDVLHFALHSRCSNCASQPCYSWPWRLL
jgi:hypothetical protein